MSALLTAVGDALARATGMTPTQARGTLRLMLKDRNVDPSIARKADVRPLLGPALDAELQKRHVTLVSKEARASIERALDAAKELDDAYDLFSDID